MTSQARTAAARARGPGKGSGGNGLRVSPAPFSQRSWPTYLASFVVPSLAISLRHE
jgi:hypothetical protein